MKIDTARASIMIVDDEPENLNVLGEMLRQEGWRVRAFPSGEMALASARDEPPDLVLLDIRMPGMDGYTVCSYFKAEDHLRRIPIIFLSAFSELSDKVRAFDVGGVDYVTKPFAVIEVLARTHTHLGLHRHQRHLEQLVQQRVQELAEAHRRLRIWDDAKNQWLNVLTHEMRTPLNGVLGITELLFLELPADSDYQPLQEDFNNSRSRIEKLMDDAATLSQIDVAAEGFGMRSLRLWPVLRSAVEGAAAQVFETPVEADLTAVERVEVIGDVKLLQRAFLDLLVTATHCVGEGEAVALQTRLAAGEVKVEIVTHGQSLSPEALETFFEVGGQRTLLKGGGDFGLGAALASRIIRLFKGHLSVRNGPGRGLVIEISLPVDDPQASDARA
ncbi:MAG: hybrid sensor histidine kinase/response regulator [Verrucomicrobiota bacterium]